MKTIKISGSLRTDLGKKSSRKLRKQGNIPCVIYGKEKNIHFFTHENNFLGLVYSPDSHIVKLDLEGEMLDIVLKDIQFHPVSDKIEHADFIQVFDDKKISISLPVKISGDSVGVKAGGKLRIKRRHLNIRGFAKDIPDFIPVDITSVKINQSVKVGDVSIPNLEITDPKIITVLTVATSRVAQKSEAEETAEEPEVIAEASEETADK